MEIEMEMENIWVAVVDSSLGWLLTLLQPLQPSSGIHVCHIWVAVVDSSLGWLLTLSQPLQPSNGNSKVPHLGCSRRLILGLVAHSFTTFAAQQWKFTSATFGSQLWTHPWADYSLFHNLCNPAVERFLLPALSFFLFSPSVSAQLEGWMPTNLR
jgi:hypothetical protein